ncbi:uncharacterized protein OCT59_018410 [Rhizophagus irregularis]|uniref:Tse2 ADP-ribosyltransferase toxin domain-containing protein n=3 Tax=Rhizophagus irregularis TaxID=588596 RepID=A0A915ZGX1_9GLOM|nr:hypothetical protein GLOIN_2v1871372 [Rhizophagus irregularis DAOM 181602=DAOM 197198]EXX63582.1 hypothetical protein RirG_151050 [Rhizophagus irregularis DAOM 197198w]UZO26164.1 hypothetical protein OCT59_018410 [Rhizophagus irregularis]POG77535.1 hypothetical protein GLOIN_2v1871372 [Rhizophagus irregularis DAOM 181602=DAOM 197198]CAB4475443.1 unnamed protein product [Rhizophagus irregularis]CAB5373875.1 unnamed protein product [Rhizophagus irregularis]|eukprot:XP_025184401.1 hypothetical protein GLOIN_2v1871372 [Rhizophagus irregularis DAOM 181602=DAOM 197198]
MEPIGSKPPQLGMAFIEAKWTFHRLDAINARPKMGVDYYVDNENFLKYFKFDEINPNGISCFVPLGNPPHNNPISKRKDCFVIPKGTYLPNGLILVFTNFMKLRFPSGIQDAWHFVIAPTERMTLTSYTDAIRNIDWELCEIKANGELKKLIHEDDDLRGVKDFRINMLYWLIEIWYTQTDDEIDRLLANDIHTWISIKKPNFNDLINDKQRARTAFSAMARLDADESVTLETYKYTILGDLEDLFGWKESSFIDPKVEDYHPSLRTESR